MDSANVMPKPMNFTLSLYAKDLKRLEGTMDEQERLGLLEEARRETEEENKREREKSREQLRKDVNGIAKPYGWWQWDEEKQEAWVLSEISRKQSIIYEADDHYFEDLTFSLPSNWEVCGRCNGDGAHDPDAFSNGWTESEWAQETYEFKDDYLAGVYNVTCTQCDGKRVVPEVKKGHLNDGQKVLLELYYENLREDAEYAQMCAMERRMGA